MLPIGKEGRKKMDALAARRIDVGDERWSTTGGGGLHDALPAAKKNYIVSAPRSQNNGNTRTQRLRNAARGFYFLQCSPGTEGQEAVIWGPESKRCSFRTRERPRFDTVEIADPYPRTAILTRSN